MGAQQTPPSQTKRPWVPVTLCQTKRQRNPRNRRGPTLRPQRGFPWPSLGLGAGRRAPRACRRSSHWLGLLVKRVKPQNKTKGENANQGQEAKKHPCRLASQEKGASEQVPGESQKRAGPRMAPRRNAKKRDARPKWAEQTNAAGQHKKNKTKESKCVWGCPVTT